MVGACARGGARGGLAGPGEGAAGPGPGGRGLGGAAAITSHDGASDRERVAGWVRAFLAA